jgi:hypothetical protein
MMSLSKAFNCGNGVKLKAKSVRRNGRVRKLRILPSPNLRQNNLRGGCGKPKRTGKGSVVPSWLMRKGVRKRFLARAKPRGNAQARSLAVKKR